MPIFQCKFTIDVLSVLIPQNKDVQTWFNALITILPNYNVVTKDRVAAFLAQTSYESGGFTILQENLNYSSEGLLSIFPTRFNATTAPQYARQPEKIANCVYASRYGNGNDASGDGWKFSGKGIIQITFHDNYAACSQFLYKDDRLVQNPLLLLQPIDAINSAIWYWQSHNLSDLADTDNFAAITEKINGGLNGEAERIALYNKAMNLL